MKRTSWMMVAVFLAGAPAGLGELGYSFDARPGSIFQTRPGVADAVARKRITVRPVAVQPILGGTDATSRARSWFDAATGEICRGTEIDKSCR